MVYFAAMGPGRALALRLFLASLVLATSLPLLGAPSSPAPWSGASDDAQMVAPALRVAAPAPLGGRTSALHGTSHPAVSVALAPMPATRVAVAPDVPDGQLRWRLGHATTSSIP